MIKKSTFVASIFAVIALLGCMEGDRKVVGTEEVVGTTEAEKAQIRSRVLEMGFTDDVEFFKDFVLVEGCLNFSKETILREQTPNLLKTAQRRHTYLVDQTAVRNVTVRIHSSIPNPGGQDWWWATQQAIDEWNASALSSVHFVYTTSPNSDIVVQYDDGELIGSKVADAKFPCSNSYCDYWGLDRKPGYRIRINLTEYASYAYNKAVMIHELGHTIGFNHANSTQAGIYIEQTPPLDSASVMWDPASTAHLSNWDKISAAAVYPKYERIGDASWDHAVAMTSLGSYLYIVHDAKLYRVDPSTGNFTQLGGASWDQAVAITAYGAYLYILHASKLYRVDPSTGNFTPLGGAWWNQAVAMTTLGSSIYIIHASKLYQIDPATGNFTPRGGSVWSSAVAMAPVGSYLYVIHNATLYEVSPSTGTYTPKGAASYSVAPVKMTSRGNYLYIVENNALNRTETSGAFVHGQDAIWSTTRAMASMGDYVYIIQGSYLVKVYKMEI